MAKGVVRAFLLGLLLVGLLNVYLVEPGWTFQASEIIVPDQYSTIQEAVNNAVEGDTILVKAGTYYEHVIVNKTVTLVGEDVSMTIIDGSRTGNVFAIDENSVNITGFTVQNSGDILGNAGLRLDNVSLCSISGNRIRDNFAGIWFEGSSKNLITANEITANVDDGIVFNYSHNNTISENHIALHEYFGIVINWSHNNTISCNNVTQTVGPSHGDGINLWRSSSNNIFRNRVEENTRYGIRVEVESNNNTISDNEIGNCLAGIQVYNYSSHNNIGENSVANCSSGIELNRYITCTILSSNKIENSEVGININAWSTNNTMFRNRLVENAAGIQFSYAGLNEVFLNNITSNKIGAAIHYSQNNMFYNNNLMNNTQQTSVTAGFANAWDRDYSSGGNFWSDYISPDLFSGPYQNIAGGDGIGDTPYVIDAYNIDNYPLMLLGACNVSQTPPMNNVLPADTVEVDAMIRHVYALEHVILNCTYSNSSGTYVTTINMTNLEGDIWHGVIPPFPLGTNMTYAIIAQDNAGNSIDSTSQGYTFEYPVVIPEFPTIALLPILFTATLFPVLVLKRKRIT